MSDVENREVTGDEDAMRLDRWFKRHYPALGHGRLQKLLRTGQVRVDGRRAKPGLRLEAGQSVRIPPLRLAPKATRDPPKLGPADIEFARGLVIHRDPDVLAINKPAGLAAQGGTGTVRHLDAMLDALTFDAAERPRLVHRLDRDTSGAMLLARNRKAAVELGRMFKGKEVRKIYWALTAGVPAVQRGRIDLAVGKGAGGARVMVDAKDGKRAVTLYCVIERSGDRLAWVAFWPRTGRTHQIRVHAAAIGTPILGDGKYGGAAAFLPSDALARQLHLHAREITVPHPSGRGMLRVTAELPPHMRDAWRHFEFSSDTPVDPFEDID
jgi:23S rRNA pseudouridine955/2504/2580 synthase